MKERPILIAVLGYIIGIIWGLYLSFSIVLCYILILAMNRLYKQFLKLNKKTKIQFLSFKRYRRYIKLVIDRKVIFIIILFSIFGNAIIIFQNKVYDTFYENGKNIQVTGIIISQKIQRQFDDLYQIKLLNSENFNLFIQVDKKTGQLEYGDKIKIQGVFIKPSKQRNHGGYNEEQYFKTIKILGKVKIDQIEIIDKKQCPIIFRIANQINLKIKEKIEQTFETEKAAILKGLLLGETAGLQEEIKEKFQIANISHILAVSGMHISYIIIGMQLIGKKILGKKKTKVMISMVLLLYSLITGFSPSVVRAVTMGIMAIGAGMVYRKNDIWNAMAISLFIILLKNPFLIGSVGLQLSYLGTIGIILFRSTILQLLNSVQRKTKWKTIENIKEVIVVSLSSQIMILPILIYHFNTIGIYFLVTNLLVSFIMGPIIIIGFFSIFFSFVFQPIVKILMVPFNMGMLFLSLISEFSQLPFSKIYVPTPPIFSIVLYFLGILLGRYFYTLYHLEVLRATHQRIKNLVALFYYKIYPKKNQCVILTSCIFVILITMHQIPKELKICFVDVGQGDCTFMVTPQNKTIMLDGGGNITNHFDVGKKIIIPYLLDQGYTTLDYVVISHFDQDHVRFYPIFITRNKSKKCCNRKTI